ncbi:ligase-associated DNA damage response endonuclease PdeM [Coralloluteibacterium thermophilus]|uniref:Ligase-associated DNA damage response endonuclease PdeM n=1 Tax=Coralloluteibacterium thermophilum TaxID=2707049 RepID=A0ABV9NLB2_9GAMM
MPALPRLDLAGHPAVLLPGRALLLPGLAMLVVADLHLGKGDALRRGGIALPRGGTRDDLARLQDLVARHAARRLTIVGDVLHGAAHDAAWRAEWRAWREAHAALDVAAVPGNHDRALAGAGLDIRLLGARHVEDGLVFRHVPAPDAAGTVVAGHLHPVVRVQGVGPRSRFPAFWHAAEDDVLTLPAFSAFTGGAEFARAHGDRVWACAGDDVVPLQPASGPT